MDTIEMMRTFVVVAREGSFTKAAKQLGMAVQTSSKYIASLEERLGVSLLDRSTRNVVLNDTGRSYLNKCIALLDQFDDIESDVRLDRLQLRGRIRITASTGFGTKHVAPLLAEFIRMHPDIQIDLELTDRRLSLVEEGFDLAIRIGVLADTSLIAKKLVPMRVVVCASPELLNGSTDWEHPKVLESVPCIIDTNFRRERSWPFFKNGTEFHVSVSGPFQSNNPEATRQMAINGIGVARCPYYTVSRDIMEGKLTTLFDSYETQPFQVFALYPHSKHLSKRVRVLIDFFSHQLKLL
ncbi:MAG: LysR family transcriptional regulator [Pseudobacteriovorax sp.]|nr:LysR family transcriptional regulator [Pseudobacteriovorax sp.]